MSRLREITKKMQERGNINNISSNNSNIKGKQTGNIKIVGGSTNLEIMSQQEDTNAILERIEEQFKSLLRIEKDREDRFYASRGDVFEKERKAKKEKNNKLKDAGTLGEGLKRGILGDQLTGFINNSLMAIAGGLGVSSLSGAIGTGIGRGIKYGLIGIILGEYIDDAVNFAAENNLINPSESSMQDAANKMSTGLNTALTMRMFGAPWWLTIGTTIGNMFSDKIEGWMLEWFDQNKDGILNIPNPFTGENIKGPDGEDLDVAPYTGIATGIAATGVGAMLLNILKNKKQAKLIQKSVEQALNAAGVGKTIKAADTVSDITKAAKALDTTTDATKAAKALDTTADVARTSRAASMFKNITGIAKSVPGILKRAPMLTPVISGIDTLSGEGRKFGRELGGGEYTSELKNQAILASIFGKNIVKVGAGGTLDLAEEGVRGLLQFGVSGINSFAKDFGAKDNIINKNFMAGDYDFMGYFDEVMSNGLKAGFGLFGGATSAEIENALKDIKSGKLSKEEFINKFGERTYNRINNMYDGKMEDFIKLNTFNNSLTNGYENITPPIIDPNFKMMPMNTNEPLLQFEEYKSKLGTMPSIKLNSSNQGSLLAADYISNKMDGNQPIIIKGGDNNSSTVNNSRVEYNMPAQQTEQFIQSMPSL